jgi:hypothetical protein
MIRPKAARSLAVQAGPSWVSLLAPMRHLSSFSRAEELARRLRTALSGEISLSARTSLQ